ncbi:MAG: mucoidy inhibitor MuiA family protein [bacterium]|nr:mucoidy inhibitor MuiA family protein [bacterium]
MNSATEGQFVQDEFVGQAQGNRICEVVVFSDQAYLKRQARVQAVAGLNRFVMELQAFRVDADSAQGSVYGEGEILSVQYKEIPVKDIPQEEVRALVEERKKLSRRQKNLQKQQEVTEKQHRFLDSMICFAEVEMPKEMQSRFPLTDDLKTTLDFLGEHYQKLHEKNSKTEEELEEVEEELAVVEKTLKNLQRPKGSRQKGIEILFQSPGDQEIRIEVSYVVLNASWEPVYKIDVPLDLSTINLTMFARIQQKSGEDWKGVKLAVSNAVPLKGAALPEAQSWYLDLRPQELLMAGGAMMAAAGMSKKKRSKRAANEEPVPAAMMMDLLEEEVEAPPEAEFLQAEQMQLPLAFEYELPQAVSFNSGSGETMLPLYTKSLDGEFFIYAAPRYDPLAYLVCRSSADGELLTGRLNVHFGGRFVGGTALSEKKAGEDFLVNLGVERGVKIRREKIADKLNETFFGVVDRLSVVREMEFRIFIENLKNETVRVNVFDSVPVAKIDRIQVKGLEIKPEPGKKDYLKREGVMCWELQVEPKAIQEIRMKFFVKHPKDSPLQGL